jgi:hypothetical protein
MPRHLHKFCLATLIWVGGAFGCSADHAERELASDQPGAGQMLGAMDELEMPEDVVISIGMTESEGVEPEETSCAGTSSQSELEPVYLVFLLDDSASMDNANWDRAEERWNPVTSALSSFFASPDSRGLRASLTLFPLNTNSTQGPHNSVEPTCDSHDYSVPVVPPTDLPDALVFDSAIAAASPANEFGTPTYPALAGTIDYAESLRAEGKKTAIVLVTDGEPYSCDPENWNNTSQIAALAGSVAAEIPTYVIGVGSVDGLHEIAVSGGTDSAFVVSLEAPEMTRSALLERFQEIRGEQISCDIAIPAPPVGDELDVGKVNVELSLDGKSATLAFDEQCSGDYGWRYDNPLLPSKIELCPATCAEAQEHEELVIDVLFGCATKSVVVR